MRKKLFSVVTSFVMATAFMVAACDNASANSSGVAGGNEESFSQQLEILKSDMTLTQDQSLSRIKAEYLLQNGGYSDSDEIVAIVTLPDDSVIDTYLDGYSAAGSVADYAASPEGVMQATSIRATQNRLINELTARNLIESVEYTYSTVINAVAVKTTYGNFSKISELPFVESALLSDTFNRPQTVSGSIDASVIENDVDVYDTGIFNSSSVDYTGKGTAVAVLDSGFDCSHTVFSNQPEGDLWIEQSDVSSVLNRTNAASFTGNLSVSDVWYSRKIPFAYDYADKDKDVYPYDSEHGTHVAGIIGGNDDVITGIAVDTQLVLMKVFPDLEDGADTEDILAALEDAVLLNVDCINMSLGSSCGFAREEDGNAINDVYDKINQSGISLLVAASNSYSSAYGSEQGNTNLVTNPDSATVGSPSTYAAALSVASISGVKSKYIVGNDSQVIFFNESNSINGDQNDFFAELGITEGVTKTYEYVTVPGTGLKVNYSNINVNGKIALVRRGDNTFEEKALLAKAYGAVACIIYNNVDGDISMSMGKSEHIPTVSISKDAGTILASQDGGTITISYSNQAGPFMSDFSSWGPSPNLELKPEITAHGGNIKSAVPGGGYDELSGTSMATPNMTGLVVLIRQYLKEKFPDLQQDAKTLSVLTNQLLMSTATIVLNEEGNPYSPRKQGAGLASLFNVVHTKAYITIDGKDRTKLELGDDPARTGVYTMEFNVVNMSTDTLQYNLSLVGMTESVSTSDSDHVAEKDQLLAGGFTAEITAGSGSLSENLLTVNSGSSVKVRLVYTLTNEDKALIDSLFPYGMYVEGFVKLDAIGETEDDIDLNVPFLAFYGDWTQAPMFDKTYYEVESQAHDASIDDEDKIKADYYATTPYGSYYYNYIIPLGTYLYEMDESVYDPIPASEEHIAISNYLGAVDGISSIYTGLLRNAKTMTFTITDKISGEVVYEYVDYNANKAYPYGNTPIPYYEFLKISAAKLELVNNRQYEFKMFGTLDYGDGGVTTNARNTFSFDFYLDDEAPVIKEATYEKVYDKTLKKDRYYIYLTVYDNHYVQAITPIIFSPSSDGSINYTYLTKNPIPVYGEKGQDNVVRIEITDYLEDLYYDEIVTSSLTFLVEDYALNSDLFLCRLPGTKGGFQFTDDGTTDGATLSIKTIYVDEVADLTQYLATSDGTVDADKDYLNHLVWSSSNTNVAVVEEGQVLALKAGTATITVSEVVSEIMGDYAGKSATIIIRVKERATSGASENSISSARNESALTAFMTAEPNSAEAASSNDVASAGSAAIESVRFSYFDTLFAYSRAAQKSEIGSTGSRIFISSLASDSLSFYPGEKIQLFYDVNPWYAEDNYTYTYASSNESVAIVDENGVITALKKGTTTITLSVSGSNLMARLKLTVNSEFIIENNTLVAYKGLGGEVVIPDDEGILYIGSYAFCLYTTDYSIELSDEDYDANKIPSANTTITSVVIPEGVEDIQKYAFYNCSGLRSVSIPESAKYVREYAFYNNSRLTEIDLKNVYTVGAYAFYGCTDLTGVTMNKVYAIGDRAFFNCSSLATIDLTTLRNAGSEIFRNCASLSAVTLGEFTKLSTAMFYNAGLETVTITSQGDIPDFCFAENANLTKVTLPDAEISVGNLAFDGCSQLSEVEFLKDTEIIKINGSVFAGTAINTFTVAAENHSYAVSADGKLLLSKDGSKIIFAAVGAEFGDYTLSENYTVIGESAFCGADLTTLTIINKDTVISAYAFCYCNSLASVTLPAESGVIINEHAFNYAQNLEEVINLDKAVSIGDYAFANTKLNRAVIGDGAQVGEGAFYLSKISEVTIGEGAVIGMGAFQQCSSLVTVNLPVSGNVELGVACFAYDTVLTTIDLTHIRAIPAQTFFGCTSLASANLLSATEIGDYAFAGCTALLYVSVPEVITIGDGAFFAYEDETSLPFNTITLPDTLVSIGDGAFRGCAYLSEIIIPSGITGIGGFTFYGCISLTDVTLPDTVTYIGEWSFAGCSLLSGINLANVREIGEYAFYYCESLTEAELTSVETIAEAGFAYSALSCDVVADNLKELDTYAFYMTNLNSFKAAKLEYIGESAFAGNARLTEFVFSDKLSYIGAVVFMGCDSIESFYFTNGSAKLSDGVINGYAFLDDGILYTYMPSGLIQLSSVPAAKQITTLVVLENTVRIDTYAGNENLNVTSVILPDSLKIIGNYAFYGYTNLRTVEFRSFTAPALEDWFNSSSVVSESDPGYGLLHNQIGLFGWEQYYYTFVDLVGLNTPLTMILPANANVEGYDSLIYEAYFGKVENAARSSYVAMDKNLRNFLSYAYEISKISTITVADETLINKAVTAYNAIKQNATDYGYTAEEWNGIVSSVLDAKAQLSAAKLANAGIAVRNLQAKINSLPDTYDKSLSGLLDEIGTEIRALDSSDAAVLDLTRYNALLASANAPQTPGENSAGDNNAVLILSIVLPAVAVIAIAAVAFVFIKKRGKKS